MRTWSFKLVLDSPFTLTAEATACGDVRRPAARMADGLSPNEGLANIQLVQSPILRDGTSFEFRLSWVPQATQVAASRCVLLFC